MGRKKRTYILVLVIAVIAVSAQCSFASSKEHYFGKTPRGQKIYYTTSVKSKFVCKFPLGIFQVAALFNRGFPKLYSPASGKQSCLTMRRSMLGWVARLARAENPHRATWHQLNCMLREARCQVVADRCRFFSIPETNRINLFL